MSDDVTSEQLIVRPAQTLWSLPVAFIGGAHVLFPLLLLWVSPEAAREPKGWIGASLLVVELICLSYTSGKLALNMSTSSRSELVLVTLTIFISVPAAIVPYLGLMGRLSPLSLLVTTGCTEIALLASAQRHLGTPHSWLPRAFSRLSIYERLLISLSFLAFGLMALNSVRYTATDSDTMWYHLPLLAEWIKTHSIAPASSMVLIAKAYPAAREAVLAWLSFPMTSDNLALFFLVEVPGILMVIYAIARQFGAPRAISLSIAALFSTMPELFMWADSQKNDLFLALTCLLTIFFMLRWLSTGSKRYAVLLGLAAGLLCATKLSGPGYAAALAVVFLWAVMLQKETSCEASPPTNRSLAAVLMLIPSLVIAAPWYLRNLYYLHNPLYPKNVAIFGKTIFAGPLGERFFAHVTLHFDFVKLISYWRRFVQGYGVALPVLLAAPLVILTLVYLGRASKQRRDVALWLVLLPFMILLLFMQQPFAIQERGMGAWEIQPRYMFSFPALLHLALAFVLSKALRYLRFTIPLVFFAMLGNLILSTHFWWLLAGLATLLAVFAPKWDLPTPNGYRTPRRLTVVLVAIPVIMASIVACHWIDGFRERRKDDPEYGYQGISAGWAQIGSYVRHNISNKRILCLGRPEKFPFYGPGYTNTLYSCDRCNILELIQKEHIDYVVGIRPFERRGESWTYLPAPTESLREDHPDRFPMLYTFDGAELLKVMNWSDKSLVR